MEKENEAAPNRPLLGLGLKRKAFQAPGSFKPPSFVQPGLQASKKPATAAAGAGPAAGGARAAGPSKRAGGQPEAAGRAHYFTVLYCKFSTKKALCSVS